MKILTFNSVNMRTKGEMKNPAIFIFPKPLRAGKSSALPLPL